MLRILQVARDRNLELHPLAIRSLIQNERRAVELRGDPKAAALFMDLLCGKEPTIIAPGDSIPMARAGLSILNETGFLGRFIPDWARIVGQMQFDTYHVFTVDEHTIEAIRVLNTLERGELAEVAPVARGLVDHLQSRRALYLAMLLHDIAKGRGGDHSEIGAEIALKVGPELGLTAEETETVSWLVLHHLLLSADGVQTRYRRSEDHPRPRRHHPVARTVAAAADPDCRRHAGRVAQGMERLEGDAAARALRPCCRGAGRRACHHRAGRAGRTRATGGARC